MAREIIAYDVITGVRQGEFLPRVMEAIRNGWRLKGGATYSAPQTGGQGYLQTVVKYAPKVEKQEAPSAIAQEQLVFKSVRQVEKEIVSLTVKEALRLGYAISVDDGGDEYAIICSSDYDKIMQNLMTTSSETLELVGGQKTFIGRIMFIYGNEGYDVVSDYTSNSFIEEVLQAPNALANKYEKLWEELTPEGRRDRMNFGNNQYSGHD